MSYLLHYYLTIMNQKEFIQSVKGILQSRFGITLNDVSEETAIQCYYDGWSPEETVDWIGRKFDLDDIKMSPYGLKYEKSNQKYLYGINEKVNKIVVDRAQIIGEVKERNKFYKALCVIQLLAHASKAPDLMVKKLVLFAGKF